MCQKLFLIPMAVGPVVTIAMGFVANLIKVLGLSINLRKVRYCIMKIVVGGGLNKKREC